MFALHVRLPDGSLLELEGTDTANYGDALVRADRFRRQVVTPPWRVFRWRSFPEWVREAREVILEAGCSPQECRVRVVNVQASGEGAVNGRRVEAEFPIAARVPVAV